MTQCFSDPEPRVRYYACESLFNIAKVARKAILKQSFNEIFAGCVVALSVHFVSPSGRARGRLRYWRCG